MNADVGQKYPQFGGAIVREPKPRSPKCGRLWTEGLGQRDDITALETP